MEFEAVSQIVGDGVIIAILVWLLIAERKRSDVADERNQKFQFRMIEYFIQTLNRANEINENEPPQTRTKIKPEFDVFADEYFKERE